MWKQCFFLYWVLILTRWLIIENKDETRNKLKLTLDKFVESCCFTQTLSNIRSNVDCEHFSDWTVDVQRLLVMLRHLRQYHWSTTETIQNTHSNLDKRNHLNNLNIPACKIYINCQVEKPNKKKHTYITIKIMCCESIRYKYKTNEKRNKNKQRNWYD